MADPFARDRSKAEVDFVLSRDGKPILLGETKIEETEPAKSLVKMKMALSAPAFQPVNLPGISRKVTAGGSSSCPPIAGSRVCPE